MKIIYELGKRIDAQNEKLQEPFNKDALNKKIALKNQIS